MKSYSKSLQFLECFVHLSYFFFFSKQQQSEQNVEPVQRVPRHFAKCHFAESRLGDKPLFAKTTFGQVF